MPSPDTDPQNLGQPNVHAIALVNGHRHHLVDNPHETRGRSKGKLKNGLMWIILYVM